MTKRSIKSRSEAGYTFGSIGRSRQQGEGGCGECQKMNKWSRSKGKVTEKTLTKVLFMSLFL